MDIMNFEFITDKHEIRIVMIEGEPWFVGKDVANILGYTKLDAMYRVVDKEDKLNIDPQSVENTGFPQNGGVLETNLNVRRMTLINEVGLYEAIFSSQLPQAKQFKRWVTKEVLPSIRKTGKYEDKENKFEKLCPVKFTEEDMLKEMGIRIKRMGGQQKRGLAYYYAYCKFGRKIGFDFYKYAKKNDIKPIDWLRENNYIKDFCKFVCTNDGRQDC